MSDAPPEIVECGYNMVTDETILVNKATGEILFQKRASIGHNGAPIDDPPKDPYLAMLATWEKIKEQLDTVKARENNLRCMLFNGAFPNPKEGVQRHVLPDGRTLKGDYKINRKLEEATLPGCLQALRENGAANTDSLVKYKPELAIAEWRSLSDENKLLFADAIVATPGTPSLAIEAAPAPGAKPRRKKKA